MMTKAMEVCGTQGSFEKTCDITMTVLREEKVSVMAMLEAFVFDPLINWRLLQSRPTQVRHQLAHNASLYSSPSGAIGRLNG
jgi:serine/threonine-protein kinase mTOR